MAETTEADTDGTEEIIVDMTDTKMEEKSEEPEVEEAEIPEKVEVEEKNETSEEAEVEEKTETSEEAEVAEAPEEATSKSEEIPEQIAGEDSTEASDEVLEEDNHLAQILESTIYSQLVIVESSGTSLPYLWVDEYDYWVGDSKSSLYNQYVRTDSPFTEWDEAEHLIEYPDDYAYALFIGYNIEGTPGAGSCFFLHCSVGMPTAGCVAVPEKDMVFILNHIGTDCGIVIG